MRNGKHLDTSKLRQLVKIQESAQVQDSNGDIVDVWVDVFPKVYADIQPLSAREFLAAANLESKVTVRVVIHFREGVEAKMRILKGTRIYNIEGVIPDLDSGREFLTLPCSEGVNEG